MTFPRFDFLEQDGWLWADPAAKQRIRQILSCNWTLEGGTLAPVLRKPFDVLARIFGGAKGESGEGKVTPLELFADGILDLDPEIRELIRAAA